MSLLELDYLGLVVVASALMIDYFIILLLRE